MRAALILILLAALPAQAAKRNCGSIFSLEVGAVADIDRDPRVIELGRLHAAIVGAKSDVERYVLVKDFKAKFQQLEAVLGPGLRSAIERAGKAGGSTASTKEAAKAEAERKKAVARQLEELRGFEAVIDLKISLGPDETRLGEGYLPGREGPKNLKHFEQPMVGRGVEWSKDGRFLAIRPNEYPADTTTRIYDVQARKLLSYKPKNGIFDRTGKYWLEDDGKQVKVRELGTAREWGPFVGTVEGASWLSNDDFVIVNGRKARSDKEYYFFLERLDNGAEIELGSNFVIAHDFSELAYEKKPGEIVLLNLSTWTESKPFRGSIDSSWGEVSDLVFEREGKKYLRRFSDGKKFTLPDLKGAKSFKVGNPESRFITYDGESKAGKETEFLRVLDTGKIKEYPYASGNFSDDGKAVVFFHSNVGKKDSKSLVVDLETWDETELDGLFNEFSPNGRFVISRKWRGDDNCDWVFFDRLTGNKAAFKGGDHLHFIGMSDLFLLRANVDGVDRVFLADGPTVAAGGLTLSSIVGDGEALMSPDSEHYLTYSGNKAFIARFKP